MLDHCPGRMLAAGRVFCERHQTLQLSRGRCCRNIGRQPAASPWRWFQTVCLPTRGNGI